MKAKSVITGLFFLAICFCPLDLFASDLLVQADAVFSKGGADNFKQAIDLYDKAVKTSPDNYDANWKLARAYREYCLKIMRQDIRGWEDQCKEYGKKGMACAEKAKALNPDGVEGHFYYGACVGSYADGVSILTALKEGLKDKTQDTFERAYKIDKGFRDGGPVVALGRFWQVLPWPMNDKKKSLKYYEEALNIMPKSSPYRPELNFYMGELLEDMGKDKDAKAYLGKAKSSDNDYFSKKAQKLLSKMKSSWW